MTTIRIPPVLRDATGGQRQVEANGADVRELLENLATSYPQLRERIIADGELAPFVNLYIEGEDGTWHFPKSEAKAGSAVEYRKQRTDNPRSVEMHTTLSAHPFALTLPAGRG